MKIVCKSWANETFYQRNNEFPVECKDEWLDDDNDNDNNKLIEEENVVNPLAIDEQDMIKNQENRFLPTNQIKIHFIQNSSILFKKKLEKNPFSLPVKNLNEGPPLPLECILLEENPTSFPCDMCDKVFKYKRGMREHMKRIHTSLTLKECLVCGIKCSQFQMSRHVRTHHAPTPFECKKCKKTFRKEENLETHIQHKHKRHPCPFCTKVFPDSRKLNSHMRIYHDLRPFPCMVCNKHFTTKQGMHQHLLLHTGKRPYHCDICEETFIQKSNLNFHRKSHPGPLPPAPITSVKHILQKFIQMWERKKKNKKNKKDNKEKIFKENDEIIEEEFDKSEEKSDKETSEKNDNEKKDKKKNDNNDIKRKLKKNEDENLINNSDKESFKKLKADTNNSNDTEDVKKIEGGQVHIKFEIEV